MLQDQVDTNRSEGNEINQSSVFHFVIFGQQKPFDAISAEMYKRATGASNFVVTYLDLIDCSESYSNFVADMLKYSNCTKMQFKSVEEFMGFASKRNGGEFYVIDAWPSRIKIAAMLKKIKKTVILIEDHPISFERFNSDKIIDHILVTSFIYKFRINRSLKIHRMMDYVISNSGATFDFLKTKWNFTSSFVSFPPIHSNIFRYDPTTRRDSIVIHCPSNFEGMDVTSIMSALKLMDFSKIWLLNPSGAQVKLFSAFEGSIIVERGYSFDELREMYSQSYLSIIPEKQGAFELAPVESLASGVPILSNPLPSIDTVSELLEKSKIKEKPFFSLRNFNPLNFKEWIASIQNYMPEISRIVNSRFSPDSIMKEFINRISLSPKQ